MAGTYNPLILKNAQVYIGPPNPEGLASGISASSSGNLSNGLYLVAHTWGVPLGETIASNSTSINLVSGTATQSITASPSAAIPVGSSGWWLYLSTPGGAVLYRQIFSSSTSPLTSTGVLSTTVPLHAVGDQDISNHTRQLAIARRVNLVDDTRMGLNSRSRIAGIEEWSVSVDLIQEFASTGNNIAKLMNTYTRAAAFAVTMRPVNAARSSDNPEFQGNVVLESYDPVKGAVGALTEFTVVFQSAGDLGQFTSAS